MHHFISKKKFENDLDKLLDEIYLEINNNQFSPNLVLLEKKKNKLIEIKKSLSFMDDGMYGRHSNRLHRIFNRIISQNPERVRA